MKLLKIDSLAIDSLTNDKVIVLQTEDGEVIPIWVGNVEAVSIAMALSGTKPRRPMTHDLLVNILSGFDARLLRVVITALVDNTFYALVYLQRGEDLVVIDARPSDSIAIALRKKASIFIEDDVPLFSADVEDENRKKIEDRLRRVEPKELLGG